MRSAILVAGLAFAGCLAAETGSPLTVTFINDEQREGRLQVVVDGDSAFDIHVAPRGVHPDLWDLGEVQVKGASFVLAAAWDGEPPGLEEELALSGPRGHLTLVANRGAFTATLDPERPNYL